jgi:hypothetical protein
MFSPATQLWLFVGELDRSSAHLNRLSNLVTFFSPNTLFGKSK